MGPFLDLSLRRAKWASDDALKEALKKPKGLGPRKVKNVSRDELGSAVGRLHMEKQDFAKLQLKKNRAFKMA
jgi:ribosome production factor 2